MTRELRVIGLAQRDVRRIFRWLESRSPRGAASWYQAFCREVMKILADPDAFSQPEEAAHLQADIRTVLFKTRRGRRYRIIFEFDANEIRILRVRQPGQRPLRVGDIRFDE
jgi:plasmid stabilization system protein ParE